MKKQAELKWPEYEVIEIENELGTKALIPGNPAEAIALATRKADKAVELLSSHFPIWMKGESNRLNRIRIELKEKGYSDERLDFLFTCAHDIKGQAGTYGYPVAAIIAKLLCYLIQHAPDPSKIPLAVIDQHVDTIRAIVRQDLKGNGNSQTSNIIQGLHILDLSTLKKLSKHAPVAQAS
jgi:HPt (histidine-containing phosphotransfer) domain-containing protein